MAFDIFLKLITGLAVDPFKGESLVKGHENEIEVQSFSWGESRDGTAADPQEMAFVTPVSTASPNIAKYCAEGTPIVRAEVSLNTGGQFSGEVIFIKLDNLVIGSYQLGVAETDARAADRFTVAFTAMDITKQRQSPSGTITPGTTAHIAFPPPAGP